MTDNYIVFYNDQELYLGEEGMKTFCKKTSHQLAEAFQSTAIYLDLAVDLGKKSPLPFFETKITGASRAYDRLMKELNDRIGEEKTQEIAKQIEIAIKQEKDESAR